MAAAAKTASMRSSAGAAMTERPRLRRPRPWSVIASALAVFFAVLALLAFQTRTARLDAPAPRVAVAAAPPRQVLLRRVIVTRVVTDVRDDDAPARRVIEIASAPVTSAPAAAPAAPVAAAPPAPAPPAPLVTSTSGAH
jgi:hypothetical protein